MTNVRARLQALQLKPENQYCCDCSDKKTSWASLIATPPGSKDSIGAFYCYPCSAAHGKLGDDFCSVKTLTCLNDWTEREVMAMELGGNKIVNSIFESKISFADKISFDADKTRRETFCREKYAEQKFFQATAFRGLQKSKPISLTLKSSYSDTNRNRAPVMTEEDNHHHGQQEDNTPTNTNGASRRRQQRRSSMSGIPPPPAPSTSKSPAQRKSSKSGFSSTDYDGFDDESPAKPKSSMSFFGSTDFDGFDAKSPAEPKSSKSGFSSTNDDGFGDCGGDNDVDFGFGGDNFFNSPNETPKEYTTPLADAKPSRKSSSSSNSGDSSRSRSSRGTSSSSSKAATAPRRGETSRAPSFRKSASSHAATEQEKAEQEPLGFGDEQPSQARPRRPSRRSSVGYSESPPDPGQAPTRRQRQRPDALGASRHGEDGRRRNKDTLSASNHSITQSEGMSASCHAGTEQEKAERGEPLGYGDEQPSQARPRRPSRRSSLGYSEPPDPGQAPTRRQRQRHDALGASGHGEDGRRRNKDTLGASNHSVTQSEGMECGDTQPDSEQQPKPRRRSSRRGSVGASSLQVDDRRRLNKHLKAHRRNQSCDEVPNSLQVLPVNKPGDADEKTVTTHCSEESSNSSEDKPVKPKSSGKLLSSLYGDESAVAKVTKRRVSRRSSCM